MSVARRHDPVVPADSSNWRPFEDEQSSDKPRTVGRYVLWGVIGSGGCATVHLGRLMSEAGFSRTVAVKRLHSEYSADPDFVAMFLDEARLAGRIHHPNVVHSLDVMWSRDPHGGRELFMIMDYIEGEALSRLVTKSAARSERPDMPVVLSIMTGVLRGLHAAHEVRSESGDPLELVHRDVSPQNVVVGVDGVARLLDFGIAKAIGRIHTTRQGDFKGKAAYMAPEQIMGTATKLSDVYSASVVLWEALTGQRLFKGENQAAVLHKVVALEVPRLATVAPEVTPAIDAIVMRGLARNAGERFPSALAMAEAIEKASPLASHSEVGAWVRRIAHAELAERAAKVALIEGADPTELLALARAGSTLLADRDPTLPVTRIERAPQAREIGERSPRRRKLVLAALLLLLATGMPLAVLLARHARNELSVDRSRPNASAAPSGRMEKPDYAESAGGVEPTQEQTPSLTIAPRATRPRAKTGVPTPSARHSAAPAGSVCTPPFLIDSAGRLHFKTECL